MDLTTKYLGLTLRNPLVVAASPLSEQLENVREMEDSGASAVVMHSLFEEQIRNERNELLHHLKQGTESNPEALTFFPEPTEFLVGPEVYLEHIRKAKEAVDIPIIGSLNGSTEGNWVQYARAIEQAGADALELNIYWIPTDAKMTAAQVEESYLNIVRSVRGQVSIPIAVKLSPFFTCFANMAERVVEAGANGLVLFNRFYQPDIDPEAMEIRPNILLSTPMAMRLPLRWVALLFGRIKGSLAASSGIHRHTDIVKMLMAGADVTMLCSALMRHGIKSIKPLESDLASWLEQHEYESVAQLRGCLSQMNCPDPAAFERAQYMRAITASPN